MLWGIDGYGWLHAREVVVTAKLQGGKYNVTVCAGDYRLGWDFCILAVHVIGRWVLCSGGCLLRFHCTSKGV